ncbi:MAG: hypothetical protein M3547_01015 [Acidobacteriota bacterium]|nr:hypothetical protein [Acidobacteriota bacterium]
MTPDEVKKMCTGKRAFQTRLAARFFGGLWLQRVYECPRSDPGAIHFHLTTKPDRPKRKATS